MEKGFNAEVLLTALLITVIFGIVMRMSPSLSARAKPFSGIRWLGQ